MGVFYVDYTVKNLALRERSSLIEELVVDTASEFTWIPESVLKEIGLKLKNRTSTL